MSDLVAFVEARLDEDEAAARAVKPLRVIRPMGGDPGYPEVFTHQRLTYASEDGYPRHDSDPEAKAHFARHDPARVLADVKAKRGIVALHSRTEGWREVTCSTCCSEGAGRLDSSMDEWPCDTLLALAQPYADHPDFDPAWEVS